MVPTNFKLDSRFITIVSIILISFLNGYSIYHVLNKSDEHKSYEVIEIIDGDTIRVKRNDQTLVVRLIGIDAPETSGPYTKEECFGKEAKEMLDELLRGREVYLIPDPLNPDIDRYGRILRYVFFPDGTLINAILVEEGYAFKYSHKKFQFAEQFDYLEKQAKKNKKGLWSNKCNYQ